MKQEEVAVEETDVTELPNDSVTWADDIGPREELINEILDRSKNYRLIYRFYHWPFSQEEIDTFDVDELKALSELDDMPLMAAGFNDMYRYLRRKNTGTREELNADFTRSFMGGSTFKGLACQPYASLFVSNKGEIMGEPRNKARATYKKHRIRLASGVDLPEDHLSFECEFMAIMGERAAEALKKGSDEEAYELLREQYVFLNDQILNWVDRFFNLSAELVRTRFYRGVVKMTKGYLDGELETIAREIQLVEVLMQNEL